MMSAQTKWRKLDGANRMTEIIEGIEFKDVVAQRMGGDADLYADILTWQTILSLGLLPLLALIVHQMF